ncbi:Cytosine permease (plasmid) [Sodalis praecaptivus]|uniref:Cytosine permease n=1 Tax=Sodalis praecaptivus TaxID=1239307 RepID=W0HZ97_9GAMM|nr:cytosine permease [Sodalis praecaptivus]AHF79099.1 Cytosine permease [Sodalis praecaptivus]
MISLTDYSLCRVPQNRRLPFLSVALVHMGMLTALDQFMLGAVLGHAMTLTDAYIAIAIGSLIFGVVTLGLGLAGMREGLSGSLLARWCGFGRIGSALIGIVIAISLLGWFGVQNAVFAKGLNYALNDALGFKGAAILSGTAITLLVAYGFDALKVTAKLAVPIFIVVVGYISVTTLSGHNPIELFQRTPGGSAMSIGEGITMVVGGSIVAGLITPDMSRYCRNGKHVFWMTTLTIVVGEFIINGVAIMIARALNMSDVVTIMAQTAGGMGLVTVIFSTLRINDINLYSSSLGIANAVEMLVGKKIRYVWITLLIGFTGTAFSAMGILERFVDFLNFLGILFPPIIGIMLVDYYILRSHRDVLDATRLNHTLPDGAATPAIGWCAIVSWLTGSIVGFAVEAGVSSLNSLFAASALYWLINVALRAPKRRSQSFG